MVKKKYNISLKVSFPLFGTLLVEYRVTFYRVDIRDTLDYLYIDYKLRKV